MLHKDTRKGGLYIIHLSDIHYYGGRTRDFKGRWRAHLRELKAGVHDNPRMQAVYNIYNWFEPEVLLQLQDDEQEMAEQVWLDRNFRKPGCVNLSPLSTGGCEGHSEETRMKMSATRASRPDLVATARQTIDLNRIQKGGKKSEEAVAKIRAAAEARRGVPRDPDAVARTAAANTGRKNTPETLARMSESAKRRVVDHPTTHGESTRALISEQQRGRVWINDGERNQRVFPDAVPAGWVRGRFR